MTAPNGRNAAIVEAESPCRVIWEHACRYLAEHRISRAPARRGAGMPLPRGCTSVPRIARPLACRGGRHGRRRGRWRRGRGAPHGRRRPRRRRASTRRARKRLGSPVRVATPSFRNTERRSALMRRGGARLTPCGAGGLRWASPRRIGPLLARRRGAGPPRGPNATGALWGGGRTPTAALPRRRRTAPPMPPVRRRRRRPGPRGPSRSERPIALWGRGFRRPR